MNEQAAIMKINYEDLFNSHSGNEQSRKDVEENSDSDLHEIFTKDQIDEILKHETKKIEKQYSQKIEKVKTEAYQEGLEAGLEQGKEEAKKTAVVFTDSITELRQNVDVLLNEIKPHVASMAFEMAEKILEVPVENHAIREKAMAQILQIIRELEKQIEVRIELAESDFEQVKKLVEEKTDHSTIVLDTDPKLLSGEFRIDTRKEQIIKQFSKSLRDFRDSFSLNDVHKDFNE